MPVVPSLPVMLWGLLFALAAPATTQRKSSEVDACARATAASATGWESPAEVARRRRWLLKADWSDALQRADWNRRVKEVPRTGVTLDEVIAKYTGDHPRIRETAAEIIYQNAATGTTVHVEPIAGVYRIDSGPRHPFRGSVVGLTDRFLTNLVVARALARAYVSMGLPGPSGSDARTSIALRVQRFSDQWERWDLRKVIDQFGGPRPHVWNDGYKVRIANLATGIQIIDDPEGQYFRIAKANGTHDVFLNAQGEPVRDDDFLEQTRSHFYYGDSESQRPSRRLAFRYLRGELRDDSPLERASAIPAPHFAILEPGNFRRAIYHGDPRVRVDEISRLDWQALRPRQRGELVAHAREVTNTFEMAAYVQLAARCRDRSWRPLLERWLRAMSAGREPWQQRLARDARHALTLLH